MVSRSRAAATTICSTRARARRRRVQDSRPSRAAISPKGKHRATRAARKFLANSISEGDSSFVLGNWSFVLCPLSFVLGHLSLVLCRLCCCQQQGTKDLVT